MDAGFDRDTLHTASAWVERALPDRLTELPATKWKGLRRQHPSLLHHGPWLGSPAQVQARWKGTSQPLPHHAAATASLRPQADDLVQAVARFRRAASAT